MIIVCSLSDLVNVCESVKPSHLISVIDPGFEPETPEGVKNHLKLGFDDMVSVNDSGPLYRMPGENSKIKQTLFTKKNAESISQFIKTWKKNETILIHCWCGISRSMATAIFTLFTIEKKNIDQNVRYIRKIAPHAKPNKLMLSFFEEILGTGNQINAAFEKYPYTTSFDCENNFAPVTIFDYNDMINFK